MSDFTSVKHEIQKYILSILVEQKYARFRDMRPPKIDTNLYSYHLKLLQKNNLIEKMDEGYALTKKGVIEAISSDANTATQPKIIAMLVIQNGYGGTLMRRKIHQPFIDQWTLPVSELDHHDVSILDGAKRGLREAIGNQNVSISHAGDCYIRLRHDEKVKMSTLVHVFYGTTDEDIEADHLKWIDPHKITRLDTAPAINQIIARTFFRDPYFFEEFTIDW